MVTSQLAGKKKFNGARRLKIYFTDYKDKNNL